mmetsp:Transcript_36600/g.65500  ORF Transcript_36600/g.65500 Transcript_36600/m.65500 type:complete len:283 (-) Transcript_36600:676-1524(-)
MTANLPCAGNHPASLTLCTVKCSCSPTSYCRDDSVIASAALMWRLRRAAVVLDHCLHKELACLVGGAHQRPRSHIPEPNNFFPKLLPIVKLLRSDILHNLQMALGWLEILPECENVHAHRLEVLHGLHHLLICFAKPEHDRRLGVHPPLLGGPQHTQRLLVPCPRVTHSFLQPLHRLNVMRKHIQPRASKVAYGVKVPLEVGGQALHQHARPQALYFFHSARVVVSAPVLHVVSVHGCDYNVPNRPIRDSLCGVLRLHCVRWGWCGCCIDCTEAAAPGACVT